MEKEMKNKICHSCKKEKDLDEFDDVSRKNLKQRSAKDRKLATCRICRKRLRANGFDDWLLTQRKRSRKNPEQLPKKFGIREIEMKCEKTFQKGREW